MEVMHRGVEEEEVVEQPQKWRPENGDLTSSSSDEDNGIDSKPSNDGYENQEEMDKDGISEKSVHFDKNEGTTLQLSFSGKNVEDVDIPKLVNAVINNQTIANVKDNIESALNASTSNPTSTDENRIATRGGANENVRIDIEEESDDEVVELEFERAIEKVHTHTPYCPNCRSQITKVILRRKKHRPRPIADKPVDLLGCLSCFSIFTLSGNCLNPFRIFGSNGNDNTQAVAEEHGSGAGGSTDADGSKNVKQEGGGFDLFGMFRKKRKDQKAPDSQGMSQKDEESATVNPIGALPVSSLHDPLLKGHLPSDYKDESTGSSGTNGSNGKPENPQIVAEEHGSGAGGSTDADGSTNVKQEGGDFDLFWMFRKKRKDQKAPDSQGTSQKDEESATVNPTGVLPVSSLHDPLLKGHPSSDYKDESTGSSGTSGSQKPDDPDPSRPRDPSVPREDVAINIGPGVGIGQPQVTSDEHRSKSLEILKCIVHGGLTESIASLSIVSSAVASDATTLNIIALGVASVISGLFVFGDNLMDLKKENANQETDRYQELLGRRGHFLLHATFAILSFLVFGIIPPVIYGFTFRENDNKDYKILAVAAASLASVLILAIGKAYARRSQKFSEYIKTILYYITMAVSVSGIAYAAGDLFKMLMDRLGWFEPNQMAPSFVPDVISATPTWASY